MTSLTTRRVIPAAALAIPASVHAHPGHGALEFSAGALHPVIGVDHLAAMLAVGLLAAQLGGRARWALPVAFVGSLVVGAIAGAAGIVAPGLEHGIALSVLVLGAFLAVATRLPLGIVATVVAASGSVHGMAHGIEIPADAGGVVFGLGFVVSSAVLHLTGIGIGGALIRASRSETVRYAGFATSLVAVAAFLR